MNIALISARWILDLLPSSELPEIAIGALNEGIDTPSLRLLAGFNKPILSEIGPIFQKVLKELGAPQYSSEEAALYLARNYAQQIVDGALTPYEGASAICRDAAHIVRPHIHTLDPFIYWADEYEENNGTARQKECEIAIVESAHTFLTNNEDPTA